MSGKIVENHVNLPCPARPPEQTREELNEVSAGVASRGTSFHLPGFDVQRCIKRESPMAIIFKSLSFRSPRRKRQPRILAIQRLNRTLFIHTEHGRMLRRIHIRPMISAAFDSNSGSWLAV